MEYLRLIINLAIAFIFLLAAYNKVKNIRDTSRNIRSYQMLPEAWSGATAALLSNQVHDCGCFGEISWLNRFPISRNILLLIAIVCRGLLPQTDSVLGFPVLIGLAIAVLLIDLIMTLREWKEYSHDRAMEH